MIVSYGTRGGGKANVQLRQVCGGVRMHGWEGKVELSIGKEGLDGGVLGEGVLGAWESGEKRGEVVKAWRELVEVVAGEGKV